MASDPEVQALIGRTHDLVGETQILSFELGATLDELEEFTKVYDRRRTDARPPVAQDRRRGRGR